MEVITYISGLLAPLCILGVIFLYQFFTAPVKIERERDVEFAEKYCAIREERDTEQGDNHVEELRNKCALLDEALQQARWEWVYSHYDSESIGPDSGERKVGEWMSKAKEKLSK